jgi:HlyD family secretion protein
VPAGSPVVRLLPPANVKIRFFVPEPVVGSLRSGQKVALRCDGCEAAVTAAVTYVASEAEYTPPVIYSNETRAKLVFMIEARPAPGQAQSLHPGQPVTVTLQ